MLDFLDYVEREPLVACEAEASPRVVERAAKSIVGVPFRHPWISRAAPPATPSAPRPPAPR